MVNDGSKVRVAYASQVGRQALKPRLHGILKRGLTATGGQVNQSLNFELSH
jgi:hypothetical protein